MPLNWSRHIFPIHAINHTLCTGISCCVTHTWGGGWKIQNTAITAYLTLIHVNYANNVAYIYYGFKNYIVSNLRSMSPLPLSNTNTRHQRFMDTWRILLTVGYCNGLMTLNFSQKFKTKTTTCNITTHYLYTSILYILGTCKWQKMYIRKCCAICIIFTNILLAAM